MENVSRENVSVLETSLDKDKAYCNYAVKVFQKSLSKEGKNTLIKNGEIIDGYPDKNNHYIDALRYALEGEMNARYAAVQPRPMW